MTTCATDPGPNPDGRRRDLELTLRLGDRVDLACGGNTVSLKVTAIDTHPFLLSFELNGVAYQLGARCSRLAAVAGQIVRFWVIAGQAGFCRAAFRARPSVTITHTRASRRDRNPAA